ncbi:MAG: phytanoyl-CoA dioxygenase family protein [Acidimicrobiales bacterium]
MRDGYAVIEGFWPRERAFALRDRLEVELANDESKDYESGAYLRFWDDRSYDEGVRRLYHVEHRRDPVTHRIAEAYYGKPFHSGVLVFQYNSRSNANTRYYHIDWWGKEFKSFLYLDDVDEGNGPFTYLRGTHKSHLRRLKKQAFPGREGSTTTFYDRDLGRLLDREVKIAGPAGTLILADVRGFHRGSPQLNGSRSVIVNYMYPEPGDHFLDR